jgi:ubiquinone/menaquinone biosynthesis C-methylase UbiE
MEIPAPLTRAALAIVAGAILAAPQAQPHLRAERFDGQAQQQGGSHGRLFPPSDLGLLEAPDRDLWQRPDQIMDAMGIADASVVADIGAGSGWFTIRLARRVGPRGLVYAEDVQRVMIDAISRRAGREGLANVKPVLGRNNDPSLPVGSIDAALMVDAYHEIENRVAVLSNLARALKPQGRIGVIDFKLDGTGPGPSPEERVSPDVVVKDAAQAGLRLIRQEPFLEYQYFLVFGK